jgi:hypothetical protein
MAQTDRAALLAHLQKMGEDAETTLIRIESMAANAMDSAVNGMVRREDLVRIRDEARAAIAKGKE